MNLPEARAALATHVAAESARRDHGALIRAWQAAAPVVPQGTRPEAPQAPAPTADEASAARAAVDAAKAHDALARKAAADLAGATTRATAAETNAAATRKEAARVRALVIAIRQGPGRVLAGQLDALGDTGRFRVRVEVTTDGDATRTDVVVEGQRTSGEWGALDTLSTGERRAAVLDARIALRRVSATTLKARAAIPVFVDEAGEVSLSLDGPAPIVLARTTADGLLTVSP